MFMRRLSLNLRDLALLDQALTHPSFANERKAEGYRDNQRLEYLGDSVLGLVVNEHLFQRYPGYGEGRLARIKSVAVSEDSLAEIALKLGLGAVLRLGRGEEGSGRRRRPSNLADAYEALLAAIYLDRGLKAVREFVLAHLSGPMEELDDPAIAADPKSILQERTQKLFHSLPDYELISESGPDHRREFVVRVSIEGRELARGVGRSRKRAEQEAAAKALSTFKAGRDTGVREKPSE